MSVIDNQLAKLRIGFPTAELQPIGNGTFLVTVPDLPLRGGWNKPSVNVHFLLPVGYPMAQPDCFWTDSDLRLSTGNIPKNSGLQSLPNGTGPKLWFSWHAASWNSNKDDLRAYVKIIEDRLNRLE